MNNRSVYKRLWKQAAWILGCLFVFGCENDQETINAWTQSKTMVEQAKSIETIFSQNGSVRSKLTAPLMLRYQADTVYVEFPKSLHVNFYDSTGKLESHLDALYGKYYETQNKVFLRDSVFIYNVKGDTLWSPELWWDQNRQLFYTDKKVRIHKTGDRIYGGQGLEASQDLSTITIKQISGFVNMADTVTQH